MEERVGGVLRSGGEKTRERGGGQGIMPPRGIIPHKPAEETPYTSGGEIGL